MKIIRNDEIYNIINHKNKIVGYMDEIQDVYIFDKAGYAKKIGTANNLGHAIELVKSA